MGVSFHEVQFPASISQGAMGGMGFNTSVVVLSSGAEHRNINWGNSRGKWDVKHGLKTPSDIEALIDFFAARYGKAYGFRFKDWIDYRVPRWDTTPGDLFTLPVFFTTNGTVATFQLTKVYSDAAASYTRVISKPVAGTTVLYNEGTPMVLGTDFSIDTTTGIVSLSTAIQGTTGNQITGATEFDVPVRFDIDNMQATVTTVEIYSWESIPVVEVREIT